MDFVKVALNRTGLTGAMSRTGAITGSVAGAIPYALVDWRNGDIPGALAKLGLGASMGTAAAFSPTAAKVLPGVGAAASAYDATNRAIAKDYAGSAIAGTGGLAALGMMSGRVNPYSAGAVAVGAPLVNMARDYVRGLSRDQSVQPPEQAADSPSYGR
jgi:hypothetical protein